tara:strand:+ start:13163 stop:17956 length:4794 start_codon:yes stop_codon:yes gene_type:complete
MILTPTFEKTLENNPALDIVLVISEHTFGPQPNRYIPLYDNDPETALNKNFLLISTAPKEYTIEVASQRFETYEDYMLNHASNDDTEIVKRALPYLKSFPTISNSIDLVEKNFKSSTVQLDLSNYLYNGKTFMDVLNEKNIINKMCSIYIVTNQTDFLGITSDDTRRAGLVTQRKITRFKHNRDTVSITLEDKAEALLTKQILNDADIPSGYKFPSEGIYRSNQRGKYSPIIYGDFGQDMVPFNLDEDFALRVDRYWDSEFQQYLPTINTQFINDPNQNQKISWIFLLDTESFAYTQIPQFGVEDGIDSEEVVDMKGAVQYFYIYSGLLYGEGLQLFSFSRSLAESYIGTDDYDLNADQLQQLLQGTYQVLPGVQFSNLIQRDDVVQDPNRHRKEQHPHIRKGYGFREDNPFWEDVKKADVLLVDQEWDQNKTIKWDAPLNLSMSYEGPQMIGGIVDLLGSNPNEIGDFAIYHYDSQNGQVGTFSCRREGYSVIIPIAGLASTLANGVRVKYKIKISEIGTESQSNPILSNIESMVTAGLATDGLSAFLTPRESTGHNSALAQTANGPYRGLRFGMRGINPWDYTQYEGADVYNGGGNPEENTSGQAWYAHYENLVDLAQSGSFVGEGENPIFNENGGVYADTIPTFENERYTGEYIYTVNKFLGSWVDNPWPAIELEITPQHWGCGELINIPPGDAQDYIQGVLDSAGVWVAQYTDATLPNFQFSYGIHAGNDYAEGQIWNITQPINIEIIDFEVEAVAYMPGVHGKQFYVNGVKGRKTISNNDNSPINQIRDIMHNEVIGQNFSLSNLELGYLEYIDTFSTNNPNTYNTRCYIDRPVPFNSLLSTLLTDTEYYYYFNENNILKFKSIKQSYQITDVDYIFKRGEILKVSFDRTPIEDVTLEVNYQYRYEPGRKIFLAETGYLSFDEVFDYTDESIYGDLTDESKEVYKKTISSLHVADENTALLQRQNHLMWNYNQHNIVILELPAKFVKLELGSIIAFQDLETLDGEKPYGENITITGLSTDGPVIRNGQQIYPMFVIHDITYGLDKVKLKATQLHDMTFNQDQFEIYGCTNPSANNYNEAATIDDGSCNYDVTGCTNESALNYNPAANIDDGTCEFGPGPITGCTDPNAENYNPLATIDNGTCVYPNPNKGSKDFFTNDNYLLIDEAPYGGGSNNYDFDFGTGIPMVPLLDINFDNSCLIYEVYNLLFNALLGPIDYNDPIIKQLDTDWSYELNEDDLANISMIQTFAESFSFTLSPQDLHTFIQADTFELRPGNYVPISKSAIYMDNWNLGVHPDDTKTYPSTDSPKTYNYKDNDTIDTCLILPFPKNAKQGMISSIQNEISNQGYNSYEQMYQRIFEGRKGDDYFVCLTIRTTEPFTIKEEIKNTFSGEWDTIDRLIDSDSNEKFLRLDSPNGVKVTKKEIFSTYADEFSYTANVGSEANFNILKLDGESIYNSGDQNSPYTKLFIRIDPSHFYAPALTTVDSHNYGIHSSVEESIVNSLNIESYDSSTIKDVGFLYRLIFTGVESGEQKIKYIAVTYHNDFWGVDYQDYHEFPNNEVAPPEPEDVDWATEILGDLAGYSTSFGGIPIDGE